MLTEDFHMHTSISADSKAPMHKMIESAIDKKLTKICFTEHMDYDFPIEYNEKFEFNVEAYFEKIIKYKEKYKNQIDIYCGIELGLMPHLAKRYNSLLNSFDFDFVIGSSHIVCNKDPYYPDFWNGITEKEGYTKYFQTILDNIESFDNFDVYGHIDYIVRYGKNKNMNYSYNEYEEILEPILKKIINLGKGIEVNTAGFKYGLGVPNPAPDVLKKYREFGGKLITVGSDAHAPEHIAYDYNLALQVIKDAGFNEYAYFEKRIPSYITI